MRQIDSLQQIMKSMCNKHRRLGKQVQFVNALTHEEHQCRSEIIIKHIEAEGLQTAIPIVDTTMDALEYPAEPGRSELTIREWIQREAGILAIEYTNSTPHSGRILAVIYETEQEQKKTILDNVIRKAYEEKIPKEEKFRFRGRMMAKRKGVT